MRIGSALLATAAALALAFTTGSAMASTRHHYHHHPAAVQAAVQAPNAQPDTSQIGNNPAKRYPTRHMSEGAIKTDTLSTSGNNPAKRYAAH